MINKHHTLRKGGLTIGFCLLQYHAKVEFRYPLGPLEGGVKVEPVAYSVMQVDVWVWRCLSEAP